MLVLTGDSKLIRMSKMKVALIYNKILFIGLCTVSFDYAYILGSLLYS